MSKQIQAILKSKLSAAKRIAFIGVGSEIRSDDAVGVCVVAGLEKQIRSKTKPVCGFFVGATAPENITGQVKKFKPTHIVIIDCADFGKKPGEITLINPQEITGISFSTHRLPINMISDYLCACLSCSALIVGIQPKSLKLGTKLSPEVSSALKLLIKELKAAL